MRDVLDLTELLAARALKPRLATFAGIDFEIRRDLTPEEVVKFFALVSVGKQLDALTMIVGDKTTAQALFNKIEVLPREHQQPVYQRIMREAGALPRLNLVSESEQQEEPLGESSAS